MSLIIKSKNSGHQDIPEDAVKLTEAQAIRYQLSIVTNWPNFSEV